MWPQSTLLGLVLAFWVWPPQSALAPGKLYRLTNVRSADRDLYRADRGVRVETKHCRYHASGEEAVLRWEYKGAANNVLVFGAGTCQVNDVFVK